MRKAFIAAALSLANLALLGGIIVASANLPVHAQGQNREGVKKTSKAVACPSGWSSTKNSETDVSMCFPLGSSSPKLYAKSEKESCAEGYHEVSRLWCSTKKP
ncbi:hypothetical protein C7451_108221 [Blastomonas natatoria]|uniref:Uncharacterized protein n=1 Tax=Blastomonas natatoria TaxID=34015 RepID=A0A2V3UYY0_9SPHN|nr:hypothetical protein [Blastomonas natatoria]PXW74557.1 hypothetical protein C7451_108221 [Blastomonas natatoria]